MTSFMQYDFCEVCRRSHNNGKKHVFSKSHVVAVNSIIEKYSKKIKKATCAIENPVVHNSAWENGVNFWCYFCKEEVSKHCIRDDAAVEHGGMFQHLCSKGHADNTKKFFFEHKINRDKQDNFFLGVEKFTGFWSAALRNVRRYQEAEFTKCQKEAAKIRKQEHTREWITNTQQQMHPHMMMPRHDQSRKELLKSPVEKNDKPKGFCTAEAYAAGLTCVRLKKDVPEKGNIYSESIPPWLRNDPNEPPSESVSPVVIGPTMEDWKKNEQMEKKRKLPPNRVGATYDRSGGLADSWLPLFGRVWSKNSRTHTRKPKFGKGPMNHNDTSYPDSSSRSSGFNHTSNSEGSNTAGHLNSMQYEDNSSATTSWYDPGRGWQDRSASVTSPYPDYSHVPSVHEPRSTDYVQNDPVQFQGQVLSMDSAVGYKRKVPTCTDSNPRTKRIHIADKLLQLNR